MNTVLRRWEEHLAVRRKVSILTAEIFRVQGSDDYTRFVLGFYSCHQ